MLKSVEGIYDQGEIKLQEKPDNIPQKTKVIVTFLTNIEEVKEINHSTNDPLEVFLLEAEEISKTHQLPEDYRFNRQVIYED